MYIYKITNTVNNKVYIGQTVQTPHTRWLQHLRDAKKGAPAKISAAIRKHGKENFTFEVIDQSAKTIEELNILEILYIKSHNCCIRDADAHGYNVDRGGRGKDDYARRKFSEAQRGKVFTQEHRDNIKKSRNARPPASQQTRDKMAQSHYGKTTKAVRIGDAVFGSLVSAANAHGVSRVTIHNWLKSGKASFSQ